MKFKLYNADCLEMLKRLEDNSVDSIVTDPPYGISFMGKKWDYDVPSVDVWKECLRVLKHGGHALIACGTRTQHRMTVNIEDAGFEIRDLIAWVYGSGFPKSLNIGKSIDKKMGNETYITAPASNISAQWEGWGTTLKPAMELWTLCRKPLSEKTIVDNVLKHGTGGINIDKCRIDANGEKTGGDGYIGLQSSKGWNSNNMPYKREQQQSTTQGRFPANLIHDGSDEVVNGFPETKSGAIKKGQRVGTDFSAGDISHERIGGKPPQTKDIPASSGSASRFFYCAKASKKEKTCGGKVECKHPTVKPVKLMQYLCRLITPKNGTILDPFMGSGTTGIGAKLEKFSFVGIELEKESYETAKARIKEYKE